MSPWMVFFRAYVSPLSWLEAAARMPDPRVGVGDCVRVKSEGGGMVFWLVGLKAGKAWGVACRGWPLRSAKARHVALTREILNTRPRLRMHMSWLWWCGAWVSDAAA